MVFSDPPMPWKEGGFSKQDWAFLPFLAFSGPFLQKLKGCA